MDNVIAVDWGSVEESFIIWRIEGEWTLVDFQVAHFITNKMIETKRHVVDIIIDIRMADSQGNFAHTMLQIARKYLAANLGKIIVLQGNKSWQGSLKIIENFYPEFSKKFIFTFSVDEAYAHVLAVA